MPVAMCSFEKVRQEKEEPSEEMKQIWEAGIPFPFFVLPT